MTDDEARALLHPDTCGAWISWHDETNTPDWWHDHVTVDGNLTVQQLQALLHFAPKENK